MGESLLPRGHVVGLWNPILVYGLGGVVLGATLLFALYRYLAHARAARKAAASEVRPPPLAPGRALLCGVVETDDDRPAVVLTLREEGTQWDRKPGWHHRWVERSRHVEVRPFTLRLPSGEAVRVLPDEHVAVIDTLEVRDFSDRHRERSAAIAGGEYACLDGVLLRSGDDQERSAYRGRSGAGDAPFVLRRPRARPLRIASGGLAAAHHRRAVWYRKAALALAATFAVLHLGVYLKYHALRLAGEIVPRARVVDHRTYRARTRSHDVIRVQVDLPGGGTVEVEEELAPRLSSMDPPLHEIPIQIVPRMPWLHQPGTEPRLREPLAPMGMMLSIGAVVVFWMRWRKATPWYERRRVVERGTGTLLESIRREERKRSAADNGESP